MIKSVNVVIHLFGPKHHQWLLSWILMIIFLSLSNFPLVAQQETSSISNRGKIIEIRVEGLRLIEKGMVLANIDSSLGMQVSPGVVSEDIKSLFRLGFFKDISAHIETQAPERIILTFKMIEKPRISEIKFEGNYILEQKALQEKILVNTNNMVNPRKIRQDIKLIKAEYHNKGYIKTDVSYELIETGEYSVILVYKIKEQPRVYLTEINVTGPEFFHPLDVQRLMTSAEIDCFAWMTDSGVFQEQKINQDLQIITQTYLQEGFIKLKIDKPDVTLFKNRDYSKVVVNLNLTEGGQYFTGKIDIVTSDGTKLLLEKEKIIEKLALSEGKVYNPFKQNSDRFKINDIYQEQGYAFSNVRAIPNINDETKIVDVTYHIRRKEKVYIGRIEIHGNYDTMDSVVRRELEIHDNELFNGIKLRESNLKINRLGFFEPNGINFRQSKTDIENSVDYLIHLKEAQTGQFNASLSFSGFSGLALQLSVSKKNFFGTGRTLQFSVERRQAGESLYDFSMVNPYWLDTKLTQSFGVFSRFDPSTTVLYDTRTDGFYLGLSYPIWKDWRSFSRYSWQKENYSDISDLGDEQLDGIERTSLRSLRIGGAYNTVNHPMFPSDGYEISFSAEHYGGALGGDTEFRKYDFNTRFFHSLTESGRVVFFAKYNQSQLEQTNPNKEIAAHRRFRIGGITTIRGHDWNSIYGPTKFFDVAEKYPYQGDNLECNTDPPGDTCDTSLSTEKPADRLYLEQHTGGIVRRMINLELLFPIAREGNNLRGVVFFDAGNVWAEDKVYELTNTQKNNWELRKSTGLGIRIITPMGVLRFEYGIKLDQKEGESGSKFDFHISGLFN